MTLAACDRAPERTATSAPAVEPSFQLELKPLTPLLPARPTHVAVDALGNVYWVQEADRRDDTLFVIGEGEIPRATQLSAANISALLGAPTGRGNIHGVASGPGGEMYFYFLGSQGRQSFACFGRFFPKTGGIQILADTDAIAKATNMGLSVPLARGNVFSDGRTIWLWVRHTDAWTLFRVDPRKLPTSGPSLLTKAFETVKLDDRPIELTRDEYELAPAPEGSLFMLDPVNGRLLKISPEGVATRVRSLVGFPNALSTPAVDRKGHLLMFAGANNEIVAPSSIEDAAQAKPPQVNYPAMLIFSDPNIITIDRESIIAYPGFVILRLRLQHLLPHAGEEGWISYDSGSGELLRLKIREKLWQ